MIAKIDDNELFWKLFSDGICRRGRVVQVAPDRRSALLDVEGVGVVETPAFLLNTEWQRIS